MPAQALFFIFYCLFSVIIFPFMVINFLIVKTPILTGIKSFVVTTGSMKPSIPEGSMIYTIGKTQYNKGDVITFKDSIGIVSHRIVTAKMLGKDKYYLTKGDANNITDEELIPNESVYGKIVGVIPHAGTVVIFYKTQVGLIIGTVLPMLLLFSLFRKLVFGANLE